MRYFRILTSLFIFFSFSIVSANMEGTFNRDYYIYLGRGGAAQGMAYVNDLNERIAQQIELKNERTFAQLTRLLSYVLTTGATFGISKKAPTLEQKQQLKPSLIYMESLAQRLNTHLEECAKPEYDDEAGDNRMYNSTINSYKKMREEANGNEDQNKLKFVRNDIIFDRIRYELPNMEEEKQQQVRRQGNALIRHLKSVNMKAKEIGFVHDRKHDNSENWHRVTTNKRVVLKDNLANEYYMMKTPPDGACWMHAASLKRQDPYSNAEFAERILQLQQDERQKICENHTAFLAGILFEHSKNLLKGHPELRRQFTKNILPLKNKMYDEESQPALIDFLSQKDVFDAIVKREGNSNQDSDTLVTKKKRNTWQRLGHGWAAILPDYLHHNVFEISYMDYQNLPNPDSGSSTHVYSPEYPWAFAYQGPQDIHVSALFPVEWTKMGQTHYLPTYASASYFNTWHKVKKQQEFFFDDVDDKELQKKLYNQYEKLRRIS